MSVVVPPYHHINFQNTSTPDFDLDRDVVISEEIALGMETSEIATDKRLKFDKRFKVNIITIIISALLFLMILAWFDFIQTAFFSWLSPSGGGDIVPASVKLWYAFLASIIVIIIVILIFYYFYRDIK